MLRGWPHNSASLFVMEFFGWRELRNRRQVGSLARLTPTPYQSGDETQEQGISKAEVARSVEVSVPTIYSIVRENQK